MREILSNQYLTSQWSTFVIDSLLSVSLWCAPGFLNKFKIVSSGSQITLFYNLKAVMLDKSLIKNLK